MALICAAVMRSDAAKACRLAMASSPGASTTTKVRWPFDSWIWRLFTAGKTASPPRSSPRRELAQRVLEPGVADVGAVGRYFLPGQLLQRHPDDGGGEPAHGLDHVPRGNAHLEVREGAADA